MSTTPDLLGTLQARQERLPLEVGHASDWCPARNCGAPCGPHDCKCKPCTLGRCRDCPAARSRTLSVTAAVPSYQPSLFSQLSPQPQEVT